MTPRERLQITRRDLLASFDRFLDAVIECALETVSESPARPTNSARPAITPSPAPAKAAPTARPRRNLQPTVAPPQAGPAPLPAPMTKGAKQVVLDDATRAKHLPDALEIGKRVSRAVGPDSPILLDGIKGQLALQRIPFDDDMLADVVRQVQATATP